MVLEDYQKVFQDAGYEIIAGIDNDEESLITFKNNHTGAKAIKYDLSKNFSASN